MEEIWGSLSVNDHTRSRALVAEVLLFDRVVIPIPPADDGDEQRRWRKNHWNPKRQRRMLDILGDGPTDRDLAVAIPWTATKRAQFQALSTSPHQTGAEQDDEREQLLRNLHFDAMQLANADAFQISRMILTREYDPLDAEYAQHLPHADVEAVVPAYTSFKAATDELRLSSQPGSPDASLIGWNLLLPADSSWSDEKALERAAAIARRDEFREDRDVFRDWWRVKTERGTSPEMPLRDLLRRADKLNSVTTGMSQRTRVLRSFAILGGGLGVAGAWFPPVAAAGGCMTLIGVGAEWLWRVRAASPALAPAAVFTDARRQFGWY